MPLVECLSSGKARWPPGSVGNKALGHECRFGPGLAFTPPDRRRFSFEVAPGCRPGGRVLFVQKVAVSPLHRSIADTVAGLG
jgi:hypothetical protein